MKKYFVFTVLLFTGVYCFAQELVVTRIENNFSDQWGARTTKGSWPSGDSGRQWDAVIDRFNLIRLQDSDPFAPANPLIERIGQLSFQKLKESTNSSISDIYIDPSTVYLTMGNRRFICFLYLMYGSYYYWVYEVR